MRAEYVPLPPPQNIESIPLYLQNELQRIARMLGGISERHSVGMYLAAASDTISSVSSTPVVIDSFDTLSGNATGIAANTDGTLTFNAGLDYTITLSGDCYASGGGSTTMTIGLYSDGTLVPGSNTSFTHSSGSNANAISITVSGSAVAGDVLDFRVSADSTVNVTFSNMSIHVSGQLSDV